MPGKRVEWLKRPASKDYEAAAAYLRLVLPDADVTGIIARLRRAPTVMHLPKDLERATGIKLLRASDPDVADMLKKLRKGKPLSPVLLVRGRLPAGMPLTVADGFHRVCASFLVDEDGDIPCRMTDLR